ncbi:hypothetical protein A7982_12436 [Minicystis rosea]|nr:hypothetical protein A7982_12436 [Minicystis rosea]
MLLLASTSPSRTRCDTSCSQRTHQPAATTLNAAGSRAIA